MTAEAIRVVSLHPTRDVVLDVPDFARGEVNRAAAWFSYPGGKGLNAARTAGLLGARVEADVLAPAAWREALARRLKDAGVRVRLVPAPGEGRICVFLNEGGRETVVNTDLPLRFTPALLSLVTRRVTRAARAGGFLVLAGSFPPALSSRRGRALVALAGNGRAKLVLDQAGKRLAEALRHRPWLIKPNLREFQALTAGAVMMTTAGSVPAALPALRAACAGVRARGVARVLLSLGARGALLSAPTGDWFAPALPAPREPSPVGCGDALLGGFLAALSRGAAEPEALRWGMAAAAANLRHRGAIRMSASEIRAAFARATVRRA